MSFRHDLKSDLIMTWFLLPFLFLILSCSAPERRRITLQYPESVLEKIDMVENNLISWVKIGDRTNLNIYDRMNDLHINGVSIAVINDYKIEWAKSYGWADTTEDRRVTNETFFQVASIGKSIHASACMQLVEAGKINLMDDINTWLKTWKYPYDSLTGPHKINLTQILSHTAGISVGGFDGYKSGLPLPDLMEILNGDKPANNPPVGSIFNPGLKFQYSGGGYEISELLVEEVSGQSYRDYIEEFIFQPLQMTNSFYASDPGDSLRGRLCSGYRFDGVTLGCKYHRYPENACGAGLWSTATDLAKFVLELQLTLDGRPARILDRESIVTMMTPVIPDPMAGLGFFIEKRGDRRYFQHSGLNEGFNSQYFGSMTGGQGVVVLMNSDFTGFREEIINSVAMIYGWKDFFPYVTKKVITLTEEIQDKYVGNYRFENSQEGPIIIRDAGKLYLIPPGSPVKWEMYFTSESDFFMLESRWANQQFFNHSGGQTGGFYITGDDYRTVVNRIE